MKCNSCSTTMLLDKTESGNSSHSDWYQCPFCGKVRLTCSKKSLRASHWPTHGPTHGPSGTHLGRSQGTTMATTPVTTALVTTAEVTAVQGTALGVRTLEVSKGFNLIKYDLNTVEFDADLESEHGYDELEHLPVYP